MAKQATCQLPRVCLAPGAGSGERCASFLRVGTELANFARALARSAADHAADGYVRGIDVAKSVDQIVPNAVQQLRRSILAAESACPPMDLRSLCSSKASPTHQLQTQRSRLGAFAQCAVLSALVLSLQDVPSARAQTASADGCPDSRCVAVPPDPPSPLFYATRVLLAPARLALKTAIELLLIAPRLEDEYKLRDFAQDVFFDETHTYGLFPTAFYETGLAPNIGVRFIHKNVFGHRENLLVRAGYGGTYNQIYEVSSHSGQRFEGLRFAGSARYRVADRISFFGIGDADEGTLEERAEPLPVFDPAVAVRAHYRVRELRTIVSAELPLAPHVWLLVTESVRHRELSRGTRDSRGTPWVGDAYVGSAVSSFDGPIIDSYSELMLRWDARRQLRADLPRDLPSSGVLLTSWLGLQQFVAGPESKFGRAGFDVQQFIDLYRGNRVLRLRARGAMLLGPRANIPFIDYPSLGGSHSLRGYQVQRFRGLATVLVSAEYRYPVQENIQSYLFVDAGHAFASFSDPILPLRVGFGAGLSIHTFSRAMLRFELATSIDGGAFVSLRLDSTDVTSQTL